MNDFSITIDTSTI